MKDTIISDFYIKILNLTSIDLEDIPRFNIKNKVHINKKNIKDNDTLSWLKDPTDILFIIYDSTKEITKEYLDTIKNLTFNKDNITFFINISANEKTMEKYEKYFDAYINITNIKDIISFIKGICIWDKEGCIGMCFLDQCSIFKNSGRLTFSHHIFKKNNFLDKIKNISFKSYVKNSKNVYMSFFSEDLLLKEANFVVQEIAQNTAHENILSSSTKDPNVNGNFEFMVYSIHDKIVSISDI